MLKRIALWFSVVLLLSACQLISKVACQQAEDDLQQESTIFPMDFPFGSIVNPGIPQLVKDGFGDLFNGTMNLFPPDSIANQWKPTYINNTEPPWYLNHLEILQETPAKITPSPLDSVDFQAMLKKLRNYTEEKHFRKSLNLLHSGFDSYEWSLDLALVFAVLDQSDMCHRADVLKRISCAGRCGNSPAIRETPGQCGCDHECFLFHDCCEDLNEVCPSTFVEAVRAFYLEFEDRPIPQCAFEGLDILTNVFSFEQQATSASVEPYELEIYCNLDRFKRNANKNILAALSDGNCTSGVVSGDERTRRFCNRPDMLVCDGHTAPNHYYVFPIHLMCYRHHLTKITFNRYQMGMLGMDATPPSDSCQHLRLPPAVISAERRDNGLHGGTTVWTSKLDLLKLRVTPSPTATFINFNNFLLEDLGTLVCSGNSSESNKTCKVHDCMELRLVDTQAQTCYWPDSAELLAIPFNSTANERSTQDVIAGSGQGSDNAVSNDTKIDSTSEEFDSEVSLCLCLKVHSVLIKLDYWQILVDTTALASGRCRLMILNYPAETAREIRSDEQRVQTPWEEIETLVKDVYNKNLISSKANVIGLKEAEIGGTGDSGGARYTEENKSPFSEIFLQDWRNNSRSCPEEKEHLVRICFSQTRSVEQHSTCFSLTERPEKFKRRHATTPINVNSATFLRLASPFAVIKICLTAFLVETVLF